jgi:hypothetical protein
MNRRADRGCRFTERRVHTVACRLDDMTTLRRDGVAKEFVVTRQSTLHCVGMFVPQPRRTLEIRE